MDCARGRLKKKACMLFEKKAKNPFWTKLEKFTEKLEKPETETVMQSWL